MNYTLLIYYILILSQKNRDFNQFFILINRYNFNLYNNIFPINMN